MRSVHPLVVIESPEEERVRSLLRAVAGQLSLPLHEWSLTRGLTKVGEQATPSRMTAQPLAMLQQLHGLSF